MPTNQPSNAPDAIGNDAAEDLTVGAVMADEDIDDTPGGGGLGGAVAAAPRTNAGTARNAAIDVPVPQDTAPATAADEARGQADTTEPHPSSP